MTDIILLHFVIILTHICLKFGLKFENSVLFYVESTPNRILFFLFFFKYTCLYFCFSVMDEVFFEGNNFKIREY